MATPTTWAGTRGCRPHASFSVAAPLEDVIWVEIVERQWHDFWDRFPGTLPVAGFRDVQIAMCGGDLPVDLILRDGDVFEAGGRSLEVVRTRGHTRGHCAYFERATGVLFSGDSVQGHGIPSSSGATVFAPLYDDVDDCLEGLRRLRALPFTLLCGAHFAPLEREAGLALIDDSIAFVGETDAQVRELLANAERAHRHDRCRGGYRAHRRHEPAGHDADHLHGQRPPDARRPERPGRAALGVAGAQTHERTSS